MMKRAFAVVLVALLVGPVSAQAKVNKITGTVAEVRADAIVLQKGKRQVEIARGADTALQGELKEGAKVTVEYRMNATQITVKPTKARKK